MLYIYCLKVQHLYIQCIYLWLHDISRDVGNLEQQLTDGISAGLNTDILVEQFTTFLVSTGNQYFQHTNNATKHTRFSNADRNKQKWYNAECKRRHDEYKLAVNTYTYNRNDVTKNSLFAKKKDYKYFCRKCKVQYNREMGRKLNNIKRKSPSEFWQTFKTRSNSPAGETISTEEFYNHFKNLANIDIGENIEYYVTSTHNDQPVHSPT